MKVTEQGERLVSSSAEDDKEPVATPPYFLETPYGYQLDLDFLKYVEDIERGNTIKRLNLQRRVRPACVAVDPVSRGGSVGGGGGGGGGGGPAQWTSTDSLTSSNSSEEIQQSPVFYSSPHTPILIRHASAPPYEPPSTLPPPTLLSAPPDQPKRTHLPPPSPRVTPRHNLQVEQTLMETRRRLEQERLLMQPPTPSDPPAPRRRLASLGTMGGSNSSLSLPPNLHLPNGGGSSGDYTSYYTSSMGSSIRHSPLSSGMTTPITNVSPLHLQHIREQMVVALRRLKELEEQVKTIPVLQVKIAVLQEEKRQLAGQKSQRPGMGGGSGVFRKRSYSVGCADQVADQLEPQIQGELHIVETEGQSAQELEEFQRLAAEVRALERLNQDQQLPHSNNNQTRSSSIPVPDQNMNEATPVPVVARRKSLVTTPVQRRRSCRDVGMITERCETRSTGSSVTEVMLGMTSEVEAELELKETTIEALKEKIYQLEVELKETTHLLEMSKLKLELQAAGGANKKKADKGCQARPDTYSTACEARPNTQSTASDTGRALTHSQGVGNHLETRHASTGEGVHMVEVGVTCLPSLTQRAAGPDLPMARWQDQCVGTQVEVCDQTVGGGVCVCEVGVNTEETFDSVELRKAQEAVVLKESRSVGIVESRSVGIGDCSIDVTVSPIKKLVTTGTDPVLVHTLDSAVMVTPATASQHTNTDLLHTVEKYTNTLTNQTRTIAVGEGLVKDPLAMPKTRSVAVGTTVEGDCSAEKVVTSQTKEVGVGPVSIHTNFLVGLKTRNIACGPSHQEGTTVTEAAAVTMPAMTTAAMPAVPAQIVSVSDGGGPGLDHYIERVQKLLQEQQMLLAENYSELADAFGQPSSFSQMGSINSQLVNTLTSINSVMKYSSAEDLSALELRRLEQDRTTTTTDGFKLKVSSEIVQSSAVSQTDTVSHDLKAPPSPATLKHRMDQQMSSALHGGQSTLKSIMKKKDGRPGAKKNLQFVGVNGGYETTSSDDSTSDESSSSGTEEEEEEEGESFGGGKDEERKTTEAMQKDGTVEVGRNEEEGGKEREERRERYELSEKMLAACNLLKNHLNDGKALTSREVRASVNTVQNEWFRVSSQKTAVAGMVEDYLGAFRDVSPAVLRHVVNMADGNGNTALHYSVSHSNFHIVKTLLDADVCNVNQQNKAGYTPIMLAALAAVEDPEDMAIVEELFSKGDVNAKASQAGQTGLMLAVSHGRMDMVRALLAQGAEVNVQDDEGSTALMCASEHGHAEIVKLLLAQPGCDATLSDSDESNALSIALDAGHKDIAVLLYAHVNFSKAQSPGTPRLSRKTSPSPTRRGIFD
ncbi:KN motif and ankyrin repeat domain-containing protein 1a isoform X2 [Esox lucius]|uniref:KN motif and ankyrin repeat domain-containing protein 1a isoform X2 n=1 Tax=Esox lucius TaxID=8010 RepID=UPI00147716B2|nr:KN motif and ankyrin repeat domain-containing protein 1a isoform X2 [Esox lucius]